MPKSKTRPKSHKAAMAAARRPETEVDICFRADLIADLEHAQKQLDEATQRKDVRLGSKGSPEQIEWARRISDLEAEAEEFTVTFRVRGLPRHEWRAAFARFPPNEADRDAGWVVDRDALVQHVLPQSIVEPDDLDEEDFARFEELTEGQWGEMRSAIFNVNGGDGSIPFSSRASSILLSSSSGEGSPENVG